jgi:hypothetical protein
MAELMPISSDIRTETSGAAGVDFDQPPNQIRNLLSLRIFPIRPTAVRIHGSRWLPGVDQIENF